MRGGVTPAQLGRVLTGSKARDVQRMGYDQISTYGILADMSQAEISQVIEALVEAGCLREEVVSRHVRGAERRFHVLEMTDLGERVMRREEHGFQMAMPQVGATARRERSRAAAREADLEDPADRELFEQLRRVRNTRAEEEGVPAYALGGNKLLLQMARTRPQSEADLLALKGMGEKLLEKVGEMYLEVTRE
jgi:ATP-dependent DNA helicase RecQ